MDQKAIVDNVEAARTMLGTALIGLRRGANVIDDGSPAEDPPADLGDNDLESYLVVGKAEGKPGDTVGVEILAFTRFPCRGIAAAVGVSPHVRLVRYEVTEELKTLLGVDDPQDIVKQQRGRGWEEQFVQLAVMFFESILTQKEIEETDASTLPPGSPKRRFVDVMIPPMTPVYRLLFKIPDDAEPGSTIPLDVQLRYGRKLSSNGPIKFLHWPNMFTTAREVARRGKYPDAVVNGFIDVID